MLVGGSRARPALIVAAAWTVMALIETAKSYSAQPAGAETRSFFELLVFNMPWWYTWAALTGVVAVITWRLPVDDARLATRALVIHLVAGALIAGAHLGLVTTIYWNVFGAWLQAASHGALLGNWANVYFVSNFITYACIAGVLYATQYARRYRESALHAAASATEAERAQRRATEARLHALQRELNPHFLFNALNAISGLVRKQESAAAVQMLARLGDLLRETLARGERVESTLDAEMGLLQHYIDIERARFGSRLHVDIDVPSDAGDALLPTFALQPLVENAIRHGVARSSENGHVSIEAVRANGRMTVIVRNTGRPANGAAAEEGVGLSNTRERLAQLYDGDGGLEFAIDADGEATATLWVPYHTVPIIGTDTDEDGSRE
jgi:LytS/YehU family sensor histidine kinase